MRIHSLLVLIEFARCVAYQVDAGGFVDSVFVWGGEATGRRHEGRLQAVRSLT